MSYMKIYYHSIYDYNSFIYLLLFDAYKLCKETESAMKNKMALNNYSYSILKSILFLYGKKKPERSSITKIPLNLRGIFVTIFTPSP